jgi:hypothetical protein
MSAATINLACVVLALATGCGADCPDSPCASHEIEVAVLDAETGQSVADSAVGVIMDGSFVDSLVLEGPSWTFDVPAVLAYSGGRIGRYTVIIMRDGYTEWQATDVAITPEDCCPRSFVRLEARLARADST